MSNTHNKMLNTIMNNKIVDYLLAGNETRPGNSFLFLLDYCYNNLCRENTSQTTQANDTKTVRRLKPFLCPELIIWYA